MKTIKFNEDETFEIYFGVKRALWHMEQDLQEWESLNKEGGFKTIIEERKKTLEAMKRLHEFLKECFEIKIEGK